jgi:hypothetical protein
MVESRFDWMAFAAGFVAALLLMLLIRARRPKPDLDGRPEPPIEIPADIKPTVLKLRAQGEAIEAIRLVRERTGCGLKPAKDAVERLL